MDGESSFDLELSELVNLSGDGNMEFDELVKYIQGTSASLEEECDVDVSPSTPSFEESLSTSQLEWLFNGALDCRDTPQSDEQQKMISKPIRPRSTKRNQKPLTRFSRRGDMKPKTDEDLDQLCRSLGYDRQAIKAGKVSRIARCIDPVAVFLWRSEQEIALRTKRISKRTDMVDPTKSLHPNVRHCVQTKISRYFQSKTINVGTHSLDLVPIKSVSDLV